jgi:translation initiation factor 2 beta subunit (eIF-2beta)/eIF-5
MYSQLIAFGKIEPVKILEPVILAVPVAKATLVIPVVSVAPLVVPLIHVYVPLVAQSFDMYKSLLYTIEKAEQKRLTIPIPKLARENRNRLWLNVDDFCNVVKRTKALVVKFVSEETMLNMSVCANGIRMYKTNIDEKKLQSILKKFVIEHVACKQCKSTNTNLDTCLECHATRRTD